MRFSHFEKRNVANENQYETKVGPSGEAGIAQLVEEFLLEQHPILR